jgi:hypothetical protein
LLRDERQVFIACHFKIFDFRVRNIEFGASGERWLPPLVELYVFLRAWENLASLHLLIRCGAILDQEHVEHQEAQRHQWDHKAHEGETEEPGLIQDDSIHVVFPVSLQSSALGNVNCPAFRHWEQNPVRHDPRIRRQQKVGQQEGDEVLVIVQTHTIVDPDAVVVEFLNANIAHHAVLRASRFFELASLARGVRSKQNVIIFKFDEGLVRFFRAGQLSRANPTRHEVRVVADHDEEGAWPLMPPWDVRTWHFWEAHSHVNVKTARNECHIQNLYYRVSLEATHFISAFQCSNRHWSAFIFTASLGTFDENKSLDGW